MDTLGIIFGTEARVKIMRLFLLNPEEPFDIDMISSKSKVDKKNTRKECGALEKSGLIKKKIFYKTIEKKKRGKISFSKKKSSGYILNQTFTHISALKNLLINSETLEKNLLLKKLSKVGKLTFVVVSGIFTQDEDSRVDILIVGNNINKSALINTIKGIEAEIGKELAYAFFETQDFQYRLGMYDKLVRDILDYPHQILIDKIQHQSKN
jgi:stalled ribosome alternative rescue factor ArfA